MAFEIMSDSDKEQLNLAVRRSDHRKLAELLKRFGVEAAKGEEILTKKAWHSQDFLKQALSEQEQRAQFYDAPSGERSMAKIVETFNALTGHKLTETEGWHFMVCLKMVRAHQGKARADNHVDAASYAALAGESALRGAA